MNATVTSGSNFFHPRVALGRLALALLLGLALPGAGLAVRLAPEKGSAWSAYGDQHDGLFGFSVATAGDVNGDGYSDFLIGAKAYDYASRADCGAAFLYQGGPNGPGATPDWTAYGESSGAHFGCSLGTAGDLNADGYSDVIIGACDEFVNSLRKGSAYVYLGDPDGLQTYVRWLGTGGTREGRYGETVGCAGDVNGDGHSDIFVSTPGYERDGQTLGMVTLYYGDDYHVEPNRWTFLIGTQSGAGFGCSASGAGDVNADGYDDMVVGAYLFNAGISGEGAIFAYRGGPDGIETNDFSHEDSDWGAALLGWSVAGVGDVDGDAYADVVAGAPGYDGASGDEGAVFLFHGYPTGLGRQVRILGASQGAGLGNAVAPAGDVNGDGYADVLAGANLYSGSGVTNRGKCLLYLGSAYDLVTNAAMTVVGGANDMRLGFSLGTAGDVNGDGYADYLLGGPYYGAAEGYASLWLGAPSGPASNANWTAAGPSPQAEAGAVVASAGDVNGDGYADVAVGIPGYDAIYADGGMVAVYPGGSEGLPDGYRWVFFGEQAGERFGQSVGSAGDVNNDGYSDLFISAPLYDLAYVNEGIVLVYHGSADGLSSAPDWAYDSWVADAYFGHSAAGAGDVNGDGYSDLVVGAYGCDGAYTEEGRVYVFLGSSAGLSAAPAWSQSGGLPSGWFGYSVAGAGDVNRDSYDDIVIGMPGFTQGQTEEGAVYVYGGSASGSLSAIRGVDSDQANAHLGWSVAGAGDVNGDGYSDVLAGAPDYTASFSGEGRALLYLGQAGGVAAFPAWTNNGGQAGAALGSRVAGAGDVNGDGYSDILVGAPGFSNGQTGEGLARAFLGSASGPAATPGWTMEGKVAGAALGTGLAGAGDVNGDGFADILTGSPGVASGAGQVSLYQGGGSAGVPLRPRQGRAYDGTLIGPGNGTDSAIRFIASLAARSPAGRAPVTFEWQAAPVGASFTGSRGLSGTNSVVTVATGGVMNAYVTPLEPGADYRWRARVRYGAANRLGQQAGRWVAVNGNGWTECGLSTHRAAAAGDYDGDGTTDLAIYEIYNGHWYILSLNAGLLAWEADWGYYPASAVQGDFDGDGACDLAVFDNGRWYIRPLRGPLRAYVEDWGWAGARPVPAAYAYPQQTDLGVFDTSVYWWYARAMSGRIWAWAEPWGLPGATPLPADYNGDGRAELAVFDSSTGLWFARTIDSSWMMWADPWGWPGAVAVPGDYDGDGAWDQAVYDPATALWFVRSPARGLILMWADGWGFPSGVPVPGDYDGDGSSDRAIYDTNSGWWYIRMADGEWTMLAWGSAGVRPVGAMN